MRDRIGEKKAAEIVVVDLIKDSAAFGTMISQGLVDNSGGVISNRHQDSDTAMQFWSVQVFCALMALEMEALRALFPAEKAQILHHRILQGNVPGHLVNGMVDQNFGQVVISRGARATPVAVIVACVPGRRIAASTR